MGKLEQPNITPITDKMYRLREDYVYHWEQEGIPHRITVKKGFEYDGASVPRIVWTLGGLRPDGLIRAAALVHDYIYRHAGIMPPSTCEFKNKETDKWEDDGCVWDRKRCDRLFRRMMQQASSSKTKVWLAYKFVRSFGWIAWNRYSKKNS
jgi:hypothetical protein